LLQRQLEGLAYREIAENLDCSEDSARAHVYQALKKLRAYWQRVTAGEERRCHANPEA
jgi:DNA-directed RNA polymerase specialized sigma24 family protein